MIDIVLSKTRVMRDQDGGTIPSARYIWRGPASDPVFALENCRDIVSDHVDVVCANLCAAVVVVERTRSEPGTITSTNHAFRRWRIYGNGLTTRGFWFRATVDANNEHAEIHACTFNDVGFPIDIEGSQSKEHLITHCRFDGCAGAVRASSSFTMIGGVVARCPIAIELTRIGDPVSIIGTGFEACGRLLVTNGPTTDSQPITLTSLRYAADQLHPDGACIVLRHAGPLTIIGGSFGDGAQRVPQIHLAGIGEQAVSIIGAKLGAFGADSVPLIVSSPGVRPTIHTGALAFQRAQESSERTTVRAGI